MSSSSKKRLSRATGCVAACVRKLKQFGHWYSGLYRGTPWYKKLFAGLVSFIVFILFYCFAVQVNLFWLFGKSPAVSDIINPRTAAASEIYSEDGKLLGKFFNENRSPVPYDSISPAFINALISTEDERFYKHHGIDFVGLFAAVKDAARGHARGASTITQQLVKNMFRVRTQYSTGLLGKIPGIKILVMKSKEMIIATELEFFCSKEDILRMYANTVDFGSNAYGIKTAAKTYFNTTPAKLKTEEAAVLVGLLKATSAYNPRLNPNNSLKRRNVVLQNMRLHNMISREECDSLMQLPIELKYHVENAYDGNALYFRQAVARFIRENIVDEDGEPLLDPYSDGLKIYTTVNSRMQQYAEEAMREQMRQVQRNFNSHWGSQDPWVDDRNNPIPGFLKEKIKQTEVYRMLTARFPNDPDSVDYYLNLPHKVKLFDYDGGHEAEMSSMDSLSYMLHYMHAGFVAIEPATGHVKAYVGDVDFNTWKYDKVQATHQPGSTFKLFVYATAMKQGLTPADRRKDEYIGMKVKDKDGKETLWQPHNADGRISGANMPLRAAFARSVNTVAVKLGQEVGIGNVIQTAHDMGISSPLDETPSLPLGSSDVTLFELVGAYATVANYGVYTEPVIIDRILDADGNEVYRAKPQQRTVLNRTEAFYMQKLLEAGAHDGGGTSQALNGYIGKWYPRIDYGGKTGTSNSHADAWFVGVTPHMVGGAWVGGEYRQIHFRTGALGQGSKTALPIFGIFMRKVLEDKTFTDKYLSRYDNPDGIDPNTYDGRFSYPASNDTLSVDSIAIEFNDDDLMDHEDVARELGGDDSQPTNGEATEERKKTQPAVKTDADDLFE